MRGGAKVGAKPAHARSSAKIIKRPNTGFQLFSFEKRAEVAEQLPGGDGKEVMKLLSETWKELRASERVGYNERAAAVPAVGTALLVRPVISAAAQGELSGWHAGEVHAMLQGARFLVEVRHPAPPRSLGACQAPRRTTLPPRRTVLPPRCLAVPPHRRTALPLYVPRRAEQVEGEAEMLEMRVEERGTAWRPAQDDDGDVGAGDAEDEPPRRVAGKAKASAAAPAPAKKRANLNPLYPSSDESEAGHQERSAGRRSAHTHT